MDSQHAGAAGLDLSQYEEEAYETVLRAIHVSVQPSWVRSFVQPKNKAEPKLGQPPTTASEADAVGSIAIHATATLELLTSAAYALSLILCKTMNASARAASHSRTTAAQVALVGRLAHSMAALKSRGVHALEPRLRRSRVTCAI